MSATNVLQGAPGVRVVNAPAPDRNTETDTADVFARAFARHDRHPSPAPAPRRSSAQIARDRPMSQVDQHSFQFMQTALQTLCDAPGEIDPAMRRTMLATATTALQDGSVHPGLYNAAMQVILRVFESRDAVAEQSRGQGGTDDAETPAGTDARIRQLRNINPYTPAQIHQTMQYSLHYIRQPDADCDLRSAAHEVFWSALRKHHQLQRFGAPLSPMARAASPLSDDDEDVASYPLQADAFEIGQLPDVARDVAARLQAFAG